MRRRLLLVLLPLVTALLAALEVPLAQTYAARLTQEAFIERIQEAQRFAGRATPILRQRDTGRAALEAELSQNKALHGLTVKVIDVNGKVLVSNGSTSPAADEALQAALFGEDPKRPPTAWPWRNDPIVVAESIGLGSDAIGAVVVQAPLSATLRAQISRRIVVLAAGGMGVLVLVSVILALPLVRWVLRPVDDLSSTAARLTGGELTARASERGGPPELRLLAGAFNRMAESLVAALERQRAFVADASHELRNPLATMRLRLDGLAGKLTDGDDELRLALVESDRLTAIVNRMLDLARAEATAAERVDFDLAALTTERVSAWAPALQAVDVELRVAAGDAARSHGSPEAVEYAIDVVLDNARKFAPGSRVDVSVQPRAAWVELRVRDHGPGLDAAEIELAGQRFWRSPRHRGTPGTGLGLATSRALIEASGGSLDVRFGDPGLLVRLRLPTATDARDTTAAPQRAAPAGTSRSPNAG